MIGSVCGVLQANEPELRKHSIYLQRDAETEEHDFDFLVLVDPETGDKRVPFLQELHQVLIQDASTFAVSKHRDDLRKWLETEKEADEDVHALNWLKIAIERYPYRLFVVVDPQRWKKGKRTVFDAAFWKTAPAFLRKRICWIRRDEFERQLSSAEENGAALKFWLLRQWIRHILAHSIFWQAREMGDIVLYFHQIYEGNGDVYRPQTLPRLLMTGIDERRASDLALAQEPILKLNLDDEFAHPSFEKIAPEDISNTDILIYFSRHRDFFRYVASGEAEKRKLSAGALQDHQKQLLYSESLSGSLSHFTRIIGALEGIGDEASRYFFLQLIEQSLYRLAIIDERIQEKNLQLKKERAAGIFQSRIAISYLDEPGLYGQKSLPDHGIYGKIPLGTSRSGAIPNKGFITPDDEEIDLLWPRDQRNLDILIIHQGILDKWKQYENYTRFILKLKDTVPFVIITSGRGIPSNLPKGIKFLPFSGLETCFIGNYFEKLTLIRQVTSLI